jgi:acetyl esterase/lipase
MKKITILLLMILSVAGFCQDAQTALRGADDASLQPDSVMLEGTWVKIYQKKFPPTLRDVAYGPHERNKLDFWKAASDTPTPLVFYIHGGGWGAGSKEENKGPYLSLLKDGVSYVSINYRLARG